MAEYFEALKAVTGVLDFSHLPVLPREIVDFFTFPPEKALRMVDGTLGNGGHSRLLLEANPRMKLLGIDRDSAALSRAGKQLEFADDRVALRRGNYSEMKQLAADVGWEQVDGILLDIGVSSPQLDDQSRGFSWRFDGPLDMRMDSDSEVTASRIVNRSSEEELTRIFRDYGEVREARKLARRIVEAREEKLFATTGELAEFVEKVLGRSRPGKLPVPTLVFQAIRIAVNDELGELEKGLKAAVELLAPGGRLAVISFHSLEDRIVKNFFREKTRGCICPPEFPVCVCNHVPELAIVSKKAITAQKDELDANRRSAPAKLRLAVRTGELVKAGV